MTNIAAPDLQATIQAWDQAAWSLAALALAARDDGPPELTAAAGELLAATGLTAEPRGPLREHGTSTPRQIASQAAAALYQASALASGRGYHWDAQSDEALLAQGNASAQAAVPMAGCPHARRRNRRRRGGRRLRPAVPAAVCARNRHPRSRPRPGPPGHRRQRRRRPGDGTQAGRGRFRRRRQIRCGMAPRAVYRPASATQRPAAGRGGTAPRRMADRGPRQIRRHPGPGRPHPVQDDRLRRHTAGRSCGKSPAPRRRADLGAANTHPSGRASHHYRPETSMTKTAATSTGTRSNTSALPNVTRP